VERFLSFGFLALPTVFISLCLLGALIGLRWRRLGVAVALASSLGLFAAATPALSSYLLRQAETGLPRNADLSRGQAIVVLGGEVRSGNGADIPDALGPAAIERVVMAAAAYRRLHLPVLVSGGGGPSVRLSEAALMKSALEDELGVPVTWTEDRSHTTWENAVFTARLLRPERITTVVLVTHAWHQPRAIWAFERNGLRALPWPAPRTAQDADAIEDFLPDPGALQDSFYGLHEIIGRFYYRLRH
jgi:uncharacterized SAM-binding protein YcdF (DUF218 family)